MRKRRQEDPEKARARNRKWRADNVEKAREMEKQGREKNPERVREGKRRWKRSVAAAKVPEALREVREALYDIRSEIVRHEQSKKESKKR